MDVHQVALPAALLNNGGAGGSCGGNGNAFDAHHQLHQLHPHQIASAGGYFTALYDGFDGGPAGGNPITCGTVTPNVGTVPQTPPFMGFPTAESTNLLHEECQLPNAYPPQSPNRLPTNFQLLSSPMAPEVKPDPDGTDHLASTSASGLCHPCFQCRDPIIDKWLMVVSNTHWHMNCLRCAACSTTLNDNPTCFWRENSVYCKNCYQSHFVDSKCAACERPIGQKDWVRRAREFVYHLACFACSHCKRQLSTGEEFSLTDNKLLCKQHYLELIHGHCKAKTKRVRTTFAEEQLSVLQAHFQIDSNPDGADLEKIANVTGLSKRVTQVWFQNSRARQKKYQGSKKARTSNTSSGGANNSGRSSITTGSASGSPAGSCEGMFFPTSVTTSADDAVVHEKSDLMGYD